MLHLHRSERADPLVTALAELLATSPANPFTDEVVAVPTRGMERWLSQRLSASLGAAPGREDGICAGIDFPPPGRLLSGVLARATGVDPDADPWTPERMVWPLIEVAGELIDEEWLAPLARHLITAPERRFARLRSVADLYAAYAIRRPELIEAWALGRDPGGDGWQPELWRALRARIGVPSGAERLADACAAIRADPAIAGLPARIAVFGLTRLPATYVAVLRAIAGARDVHLMLLHPSAALWDAVAGAIDGGARAGRRREDETGRLAVNRLLASWGRDARELELVLMGESQSGAGAPAHGIRSVHHPLPASGPATLLGRIQADIRANVRPPGAPLPGRADERFVLDPADASIRIHACHGRARQVDVMREAILHRLADDPTLEPRDIIVMCPDVEEFAPLIAATFGTASEASGGELRVRLADRSLRQTNPLLAVVSRLLELPGSRLTVSGVLDLIDMSPVRRRFGLGDDDLAQIRRWASDAAIHWGLDAADREPFGLGGVLAGTWRSGLRRLALAATVGDAGGVTEPAMFGRYAPAGRIDSGGIELVGRLGELIDRIGSACEGLGGPQPLEAWLRRIGDAADALCDGAPDESWQRAELDWLLADVAATAGHVDTPLGLPEFRALVADRLRGRPTRANFRTGQLTVCTLSPMRSVPHRIVCLLGLDDDAFPRRGSNDGDDLLLADPIVGERDPRSEDRQLLLDALLAAEQAVIITYGGADERTNAPRPPAVPVGELLDAVDSTARLATGGRAREGIVTRHPLQPFDPVNFEPARLCESPVAWSFDAAALAGARAMTGPTRASAAFLSAPLPQRAPEDAAAIRLEDLIAFAERPPRAFLTQRLGIAVGEWEDELSDDLPITLDGLARYGTGQRLLTALLAGVDPAAATSIEIARGLLPPGQLAGQVVADVSRIARPIAARVQDARGGHEVETIETNLRVGGRQLIGTVTGSYGPLLISGRYARLTAPHRIGAWVRQLVLSVARPEVAWEAVTIGREPSGGPSGGSGGPSGGGPAVAVRRIRPLPGPPEARRAAALAELEALIALYDQGMRSPLPLPPESAAAFLEAERDARSGVDAAGQTWTSRFNFTGEEARPEHELIFRGELPIDGIRARAVELWGPLLEREVTE